VPRTIGRRTSALRNTLAVLSRHTTEGTLIDPTICRARERYTVMFELDDSGRRLFAHELDCVLVSEPVGALYRVVEVITPVVFAHVTESSRDATLRRHRVAARREYFGDARRRQASLGKTERRAKTRAASSDHDDVIGVISEGIRSQLG